MISFPGCKINLGLHVLRRRQDGFHDIETCFFPVPWTDILELLPSDNQSFQYTGLSIPGDANDNLCIKAYLLLQKDFALPPVQGHLHKLVPIGAGLGGGSADAAHTLRILSKLFNLGPSREQLNNYAQSLGSDCAFFLLDQPAIGTGRGEVLEPIELSLRGFYLVIAAPNVHIGTAQAYGGVTPRLPERSVRSLVERPVSDWRNSLTNDFEASIFRQYPEVAQLKQQMYNAGAIYASMSGSGSSVFGLFDKEVSRTDHFSELPGWSGWL